MHTIEYGWPERMRTVQLYAYRFDAADFRPFGSPDPHAHVASVPVRPLGPRARRRPSSRHEAAGIQLRVVDNLWEWWNEVITSSLGFRGIRLRNARPPR